jgi:hypothetical protein
VRIGHPSTRDQAVERALGAVAFFLDGRDDDGARDRERAEGDEQKDLPLDAAQRIEPGRHTLSRGAIELGLEPCGGHFTLGDLDRGPGSEARE